LPPQQWRTKKTPSIFRRRATFSEACSASPRSLPQCSSSQDCYPTLNLNQLDYPKQRFLFKTTTKAAPICTNKTITATMASITIRTISHSKTNFFSLQPRLKAANTWAIDSSLCTSQSNSGLLVSQMLWDCSKRLNLRLLRKWRICRSQFKVRSALSNLSAGTVVKWLRNLNHYSTNSTDWRVEPIIVLRLRNSSKLSLQPRNTSVTTSLSLIGYKT
jgi:hypothetical protein